MEKSQASLSDQVKRLEEAVAAEKKKTLDAKDEALQLSKTLAEMQPHMVENNMRKDEIDRLTKQTKQLESKLKETEMENVVISREIDDKKKVLYLVFQRFLGEISVSG